VDEGDGVVAVEGVGAAGFSELEICPLKSLIEAFPDARAMAVIRSWMLRSSRPVRVSRRSTGMPSARLAVILSIRCSPPEQGRAEPRAAITAGQSMTAPGCPLPGSGVDGDEPAGEVGAVQPGLGDEELRGGLEAAQAFSMGAECGCKHVG